MLTQTIRRTPTFSCRASLISWIPVLLMNSGSSNGGFSIPLFPCRYFRLKHQCLGTGTVFLVAFKCTSSLGSWAVTSCISTTSGRATNWSEVAAGEIKSYHLFRIRHGPLDWKHKPYIFTCLSSATVSRFILLSFFLDSFGASGLISCTWETFQMFSTWADKYSYFLLRSRKKWRCSNLITVVTVFLLLLKSFFPQHSRLVLLRLIGLLLLLFLHIISQLEEDKDRQTALEVGIKVDALIFNYVCCSHLKRLKNSLEEDVVGVVNLWLLCDVLNLHLLLLLFVLLLVAALLLLLLRLLLLLLRSLLLALLFAVPAFAVFLRKSSVDKFRDGTNKIKQKLPHSGVIHAGTYKSCFYSFVCWVDNFKFKWQISKSIHQAWTHNAVTLKGAHLRCLKEAYIFFRHLAVVICLRHGQCRWIHISSLIVVFILFWKIYTHIYIYIKNKTKKMWRSYCKTSFSSHKSNKNIFFELDNFRQL